MGWQLGGKAIDQGKMCGHLTADSLEQCRFIKRLILFLYDNGDNFMGVGRC
jgi:hypothetical protein